MFYRLFFIKSLTINVSINNIFNKLFSRRTLTPVILVKNSYYFHPFNCVLLFKIHNYTKKILLQDLSIAIYF